MSDKADENIKFSAEITGTEGLALPIRKMLIRECVDFIAKFTGEWLKNIDFIAEQGFTVNDEGNLVCGREHFRKGAENLGVFTDFPNLMAVGQALMTHNINVTHKDEQETSLRVPPVGNRGTFRNGSTCGPDCPTHSHTHIRKVL